MDDSTQLVKVKKLAKMKIAVVMAYMIQCLSGTAMLNAMFNFRAKAGWLTGKACQLFDNFKHKYNPMTSC